MLIRSACVLSLALLASCASTRPLPTAGGRPVVSPKTTAFESGSYTEFAGTAVDGPTALDLGLPPAPPLGSAAPTPAPAPMVLDGDGGYTTIKGGVFIPANDLSSLDTGASAELVFGKDLIPFLAIEGSVGFLSADGSGLDMQAIPLYVQARANLPIAIIELYGGLGVGAMYVDINNSQGNSKSDFAAAANGFLGLEVGLGNLAVGVEGKYHVAEEVGGVEVEGTSAMITGRLPF